MFSVYVSVLLSVLGCQQREEQSMLLGSLCTTVTLAFAAVTPACSGMQLWALHQRQGQQLCSLFAL